MKVDDSDGYKKISKRVVKCLKNVSFVANSIHLWLERRVVCKSYTKYFTYELSNYLVPSTLISTVELVLSISSRPSVNYPTKKFITQGQSNLCLCLFIVMVPILNLFYLCNIYLGGIIAYSSYQDLWGALLLSFCNVEQFTYIKNSADLILPYLEVGVIFFKYRDVINTATCFCDYDNYKRKCE